MSEEADVLVLFFKEKGWNLCKESQRRRRIDLDGDEICFYVHKRIVYNSKPQFGIDRELAIELYRGILSVNKPASGEAFPTIMHGPLVFRGEIADPECLDDLDKLLEDKYRSHT